VGRGLLIALLAVLTVGVLAVSGAARTPGGGGTPAPASFRLSDGSAGCAFDGVRLACATAAVPMGVVLEPDGSSRPARQAVLWDDATPVLNHTDSWWHGGYTCRVEDRLVCERESGSISVGAGGVGGAASSVSP
jgi:hypothetical protein